MLTFLTWCVAGSMFTPACLAKPPHVVKSVPENGAINVDPKLRELLITFDQAMSKGGQSVVGGGETFPEVVGKNPGKWRGTRTFAFRVKLKPNHSYWLSINNQKFQNFKNRQGESAVPYPLQFKTGAGESSASGSEEETSANKHSVDQLQEAIMTQYSHRDRLGIDWPALFSANREPLEAARDPREFAQLAATLMSRAQDKHLWFKFGEETLPSYVNPAVPNVNYRQLPKLVPNWKQHSPVLATGQWKDGVAYLWIGTWSHDKIRQLAPVFEILKEFKDSPALIIDVRGNGGGDERIPRSLAGCFIEKPAVYAKHVLVDADAPGGFSTPHERVVAPNTKQTAYRGKVAVLSGPVVLSSCEAFLLMMKQVPDAVLVGAASQGSSGNPQPVELDNGVIALLPCWKAMTPEGVEFEGVGIPPDIPVNATREAFARGDPVIDAALAHLRTQLARGK
jgi:hypothetical protein